ncbi:DUF4153 domain-containing protein [Rhodobium gokarnense]|uniref:DUF4153 domain-containing protein n=1 Tax=Rhodobium gokarnense TaxID=364296 RepID=A0ABT3HFN9_9HYPH|nr:DUF4153 domain-containing protein [Rhodobium gokarnense]MCW2309220.1 hypothetical protein [Rhodobium gokarnense]
MSWVSRQFQQLGPEVRSVASRFPVAVAGFAVLTVLAIMKAHEEVPAPLVDAIEKVLFGLAVGGLYAVAGTLFGEARRLGALLGQGIALALYAGALAVVLGTGDLGPGDLFFLGAAVLLVGLAPYLARKADLDGFWLFNQQAFIGAVFALFGALMFFLGVLLIEQSIKILFGLGSGDLAFKILLPVSLCFLAPVAWLAMLPVAGTLEKAEGLSALVVSPVHVLNRFVLVPLLTVYAAVLLAYAAQIVVSGELPKNQIGWMVSGFGAIGALSFLVLFGERATVGPFFAGFRRFWFPATIIPVILLAIAVWLRVDAYGLTPERIFLVLVALWLALMALVFTATLGRADIRLIPGILAVLFLLGSLGPLSPEALTARSQTARILAMLTEAGAIEDGRLVADHDVGAGIDGDTRRNLRSALQALRNVDRLDALRPLIADADKDVLDNARDSGDAYRRISTLLDIDPASVQARSRKEARIVARGTQLFSADGVTVYGPFDLWAMSNRAIKVRGLAVSRIGETGFRVELRGSAPLRFDFANAIERALDRAGDKALKAPLSRSAVAGERRVTITVYDGRLLKEKDGPVQLSSARFVVVVTPRGR